MQEKLKQLELLISRMVTRQKELQGENDALKARVRVLENGAEKWKETEVLEIGYLFEREHWHKG